MTKPHKKTSNQMWGGRFESAPSDIMVQINASIDIDKRMWRQDISGSMAHCKMLVKQEIITADEGNQILDSLEQVAKNIESGNFEFKASLEDIHMNIESALKDLIGDVAGKLHTARSRNDQVATDFRLWLRDADVSVQEHIETLQATLALRAKENEKTIMPGFTHLQVAQPITLAVHLDAYVQMLERDKNRFSDCLERINESPLGAAALAGTSFPIDREFTSKELGFNKVMSNTLDSVSARDFAIEFLADCSICLTHLSRLAEELVIWSTSQFAFVSMSDTYSTGSSIMPQKKNPDAAELIRAKTGRMNGNLIQLLTVMKALPLAYNKDMQEDKAGVFESYDIIILCLQAMNGMIAEMTVNKENMLTQAESGFSTATDLADWLVKKLNMPFRDAHHVTGKIVKIAEDKNCKLDELVLSDMQAVEPQITQEIFEVLNVSSATFARI